MTYTSYKKYFELYTEIHGTVAVKMCQVELPKKDIKLLSDIPLVLFKAGLCTGVQDRIMKLCLPPGAYATDGFNAKVNAVVLQQRQV